MNACVRCGDPIDRSGGKLLLYCSRCVHDERPAGWSG